MQIYIQCLMPISSVFPCFPLFSPVLSPPLFEVVEARRRFTRIQDVVAHHWIWFEQGCIHGWGGTRLSPACGTKLYQRKSTVFLMCEGPPHDALSYYNQQVKGFFHLIPRSCGCWPLRNQHRIYEGEVSQSSVMQISKIYQLLLCWKKINQSN